MFIGQWSLTQLYIVIKTLKRRQQRISINIHTCACVYCVQVMNFFVYTSLQCLFFFFFFSNSKCNLLNNLVYIVLYTFLSFLTLYIRSKTHDPRPNIHHLFRLTYILFINFPKSTSHTSLQPSFSNPFKKKIYKKGREKKKFLIPTIDILERQLQIQSGPLWFLVLTLYTQCMENEKKKKRKKRKVTGRCIR